MWVWLPLLAFALGVIVGRFSVRRYRHDRIAWAQRRLQLKVLSLEVQQNLMTLTPLIFRCGKGGFQRNQIALTGRQEDAHRPVGAALG